MVAKVTEAIKDATDLADVRADLQKIIDAQNGIQQFGDTVTAYKLNAKLRQKYPIIDEMFALVNTICGPAQQSFVSANQTETAQAVSALQQVRCGILCHVVLKKGICKNIKQFIKSIN